MDAGVSSRRLSRTQDTRLKSDYAALFQTEAVNARDGISDRERDDLDARLDALDTQVGDTVYGGSAVLDNRTRLTNIERALGASGLGAALQAQARVELSDLTRLDAASHSVQALIGMSVAYVSTNAVMRVIANDPTVGMAL